MISKNEDALLCDMAETYGIMDPESLPLIVYARLAAGLRSTSRIKMELRGEIRDDKTLILALIFDRVNRIFTKEEPKSLFKMLTNQEETNNDREIFDSPEDFERQWENG